MQVGDLVKYITSSDVGVIVDKEYSCYKEETYKVYWLNDGCCDWWDLSDLEVLCK